jgi:hypothetical protein
MLRKVWNKLRPKRELAEEDERAYEEAQRLREDAKTLKASGVRGPSVAAHGGQESTGREPF